MLTTDETAARLEVTPARVRQMIIAGRLPAQRFGRSHMILESDLQLVEGRKPGRPRKPQAEAATKKASKAK
jgi:excisionase family DNA binding protein